MQGKNLLSQYNGISVTSATHVLVAFQLGSKTALVKTKYAQWRFWGLHFGGPVGWP